MLTYYKFIVSYDGTDYAGWQEQPDQKTIAGTLKKTFERVFRKEIALVGASRTDAGVHALGQTARFYTDIQARPERFKDAWNNKLPPDIVIHSLEKITDAFHPQRNVLQKTYFYHFYLGRPLPFTQRYAWFYQYPVDILKLQQCLNIFVGTHDFRSFCSGDDMYEGNTVRTIDEISIHYLQELGVYRIIVKGESFLRYMIRRIVGASLEVASRNFFPIELLQKTLEKKDPRHLLPNAPAKGLMLYEISYK